MNSIAATSPIPTGLKKIQKYDFIDAIRGIAFLGVFTCHASPVVARLGCPRALTNLGLQGGIGVQLFFIASALTLMLSLDARSSEPTPLRNFYLRRYFRIAPLFYLAIIFYSLCFGANRDTGVPQRLTVGSFLTTLTFTNGWSPQWINQVVPGGWSIAVEMSFYLLVPFFHSRLTTARQSIIAMVLIYAAGWVISEATLAWLEHGEGPDAFGMNQVYVHYWLPYQLYRFFVGFTLYFLVRDRLKADPEPKASRAGFARSLALLGASILLLGLCATGLLARIDPSPFCTIALLCFCWSLAIVPLRLFVNRATRWIGKLSFSAYLSHFAVIYVVERAFHAVGPITGPLPWPIVVPAFVIVSLTLTLIVSEGLYSTVEKPGQSLGRRMIEWLSSSRVQALVGSTQVARHEEAVAS